MFSNQNLKLFPIHTVCYKHIVMKMLSVSKYLFLWPLLQQTRGTGKQPIVNPWQHLAGNDNSLTVLPSVSKYTFHTA
jgi:hypothetical protein